MKQILLCIVLITGLQLVIDAEAKSGDTDSRFAVKLNAGTLGFGGEAIYGLSDNVNLRAGANFFNMYQKWDFASTEDFDFATDTKLQNVTILADWHPFAAVERLKFSGGIVWNMNSFRGILTPVKSFAVGGDVYTPDELGEVNVDFSFPAFAPYASFGFGNPVKGSPFGINFEAGVFYQQSPGVNLTADGLLGPTESQAPIIQNNVSWANLYPVLTASLYYRF